MTEGSRTIIVTAETTRKNIILGDLRTVVMSTALQALTPKITIHIQ